jgi:hypothetical protein
VIDDNGYDGTVRWGLVQPAGWAGVAETLARGVDRWWAARIRARTMTDVTDLITRAGARAEITVVEDAGSHWTLTLGPAVPAGVPVAAEAREA